MTTTLGRVGGAVAESLAYLNSPAAIAGQLVPIFAQAIGEGA